MSRVAFMMQHGKAETQERIWPTRPEIGTGSLQRYPVDLMSSSDIGSPEDLLCDLEQITSC